MINRFLSRANYWQPTIRVVVVLNRGVVWCIDHPRISQSVFYGLVIAIIALGMRHILNV